MILIFAAAGGHNNSNAVAQIVEAENFPTHWLSSPLMLATAKRLKSHILRKSGKIRHSPEVTLFKFAHFPNFSKHLCTKEETKDRFEKSLFVFDILNLKDLVIF